VALALTIILSVFGYKSWMQMVTEQYYRLVISGVYGTCNSSLVYIAVHDLGRCTGPVLAVLNLVEI
jgi:hypothetical protein